MRICFDFTQIEGFGICLDVDCGGFRIKLGFGFGGRASEGIQALRQQLNAIGMREEGRDMAVIVNMALKVISVKEDSFPGPVVIAKLVNGTLVVMEIIHTRAEHHQQSTCPGTGNRPPGREPFGQAIRSS